MFAASRTESVTGQVTILISSVALMEWESAKGVLWGTMWLIKLFVFLNELNKKKLNQKGSANDSESTSWAGIVKT